MFQAPYYNYSMKYDIGLFKDHALQNLLALFVSKKQEYLSLRMKPCPKFCREDYFFVEFIRFIGKYMNYETLAVDAMIYFNSTAEQVAGTQLGAGGTGNKSSSYAKSMRDSNQRSVESTAAKVAYMETKYRTKIRGDKDERVFLDVPRIWDLITEEKYVMPEKWLAVVARAYDDETLVAPVPADLDKALVPLAIRNKVVQKHAAKTTSRAVAITGSVDDDAALVTPTLVPPEPANKIEIDAELKKMMEDEDW
jgi:hypothetical protein